VDGWVDVEGAVRVAVGAVQLNTAQRGTVHSLCGAVANGLLLQDFRVIVVNQVTEYPAI
jgi:hypothetical protein